MKYIEEISKLIRTPIPVKMNLQNVSETKDYFHNAVKTIANKFLFMGRVWHNDEYIEIGDTINLMITNSDVHAYNMEPKENRHDFHIMQYKVFSKLLSLWIDFALTYKMFDDVKLANQILEFMRDYWR